MTFALDGGIVSVEIKLGHYQNIFELFPKEVILSGFKKNYVIFKRSQKKFLNTPQVKTFVDKLLALFKSQIFPFFQSLTSPL